MIILHIKRGELYYADLAPVVGSEQGGCRPVLILQNDIGNKYSPTTIVCVVTSKLSKADIPTHVYLGERFGLRQNSMALCEQIRTIDKRRLKERIGCIDDESVMAKIEKALCISLHVK